MRKDLYTEHLCGKISNNTRQRSLTNPSWQNSVYSCNPKLGALSHTHQAAPAGDAMTSAPSVARQAYTCGVWPVAAR